MSNVVFSAKTVAIAAVAVLVIVGSFLLVQDQRHGWPFSRHHGVAVNVAPEQTSSQHAAANATQPRVPVSIDTEQMQSMGIQVERVSAVALNAPARAVATVVADESRISHVHTRVSGWLEELFVNTTGETVRAGQPLAAVFSQELFSSQSEFIAALQQSQSGPKSAVLEAARTRLKVLGMSDAEIAQLESSRQVRRVVTIVAPRSGIVLRRGVTAGTAVDPSTEIVTIADLSRVWVLAEVPEADAAQLKPGVMATLHFPASGRDAFKAPIEFIYPTLTERTRTVRVRMVVSNSDGRLRPGLYGNAEFAALPRQAIMVPRDAVVYTGDDQHVFVLAADGTFEPRNVKVGDRTGERIEVIDGLKAGEQVVTTGVFLIDSESRLRASGGVAHAGHGGATQERAAEPGTNEHAGHESNDHSNQNSK